MKERNDKGVFGLGKGIQRERNREEKVESKTKQNKAKKVGGKDRRKIREVL